MPTDEPLSAQQLQQIGAKASQALQAAVDRLNLRQQCLEMAVRAGAPPEQVVSLAENMLGFLIKPAQDVRVIIEPPT